MARQEYADRSRSVKTTPVLFRVLCVGVVCLGVANAEDKVPPPPPPPPAIDLDIAPLPPVTLQPTKPVAGTTPAPAKPPESDLTGAPENLAPVAQVRTVTRTAPLDYGDYLDVRLGLNLSPRSFAVETQSGARTSESFDQAGGGTLLVMASPGLHSVYGGLIYGGGIGWEGGTRKDLLGNTQTYDFYSIDLHLGYGFPFSRRLQLEILGGLGFGGGIYSINGNGDYSGTGILYELAANLVYTSRTGFQGGLHLAYSGTSASLENSTTATTSTITLSTSGVAIGLIIGARL